MGLLRLHLTSEEIATILAALRCYQHGGFGDPTQRPDWLHRIATRDEQLVSLDDPGIDRLCEYLNVGQR